MTTDILDHLNLMKILHSSRKFNYLFLIIYSENYFLGDDNADISKIKQLLWSLTKIDTTTPSGQEKLNGLNILFAGLGIDTTAYTAIDNNGIDNLNNKNEATAEAQYNNWDAMITKDANTYYQEEQTEGTLQNTMKGIIDSGDYSGIDKWEQDLKDAQTALGGGGEGAEAQENQDNINKLQAELDLLYSEIGTDILGVNQDDFYTEI